MNDLVPRASFPVEASNEGGNSVCRIALVIAVIGGKLGINTLNKPLEIIRE